MAEGMDSPLAHDQKIKPQVVSQLHPGKRRPRSATAAGALNLVAPAVEVVEPYLEYVDLDVRRSLTPRDLRAARQARQTTTPGGYAVRPTARVATYPTTGPGVYLSQLNASPQMGSQTPWTKRYDHYKYYGFAGRGATSSWAQNPKNSYLYAGQHI